MSPNERLAPLLDPIDPLVDARGDCDRRTFHTGDARALENCSFLGIEPIDLLLYQLPDVLRYSRLDVTDIAVQPPAPFGADDDPIVGKIVREMDHEQRIAFAPPVYHASQPSRETMTRK